MSVLTPTKGMDRGAWLKARKAGIGGSDAAAICGLDRYRSPMAVYLEKTGQIEPEEAGEAAAWGVKLESLVADEFAAQTGLKVRRRNAILQHPTLEWMLANIDRTISGPDGPGVLEIKTTSAWIRKDWEEDRIPDRVQVQLQHYLAITGNRYGYVAVLIGGQTYRHYRVDPDEEVIHYLIDLESRFWHQHVLAGVPPEVDGSDASSEVLSRLYPAAKPASTVVLEPSALDLISDYRAAVETVKAWESRRDEAANRLKALLGDAERGIVHGDEVCTWKTVTSHRLDTKALKEVEPDVYDRYVKESVTRRFLVKS